MSEFAGGTNSKDKQEIAPAVPVVEANTNAAAAAPAAAPTAGGSLSVVESPAVATKAPEPSDAAGSGDAIRKNEMMYRAKKQRDPFRSLVSGEGRSRTDRVDLSVVTLVGVVASGDMPFCVVEDAEGVSYVLRKGDRVKNGRVVSIQMNTLVASQTILGYTTTVRLKLQEGKDVKNG